MMGQKKMISVRIDKELKRRFEIAMAKNGDKITNLVINFITDYINKSEKENDK